MNDEYEAVFFRAEVIDPQGRSFVAHTRERVVFLSGCDDPTGGARSLPDDCGVGSGSPPVPEGDRGGGGCEQSESGAVDDTSAEPDGTDPTAGGTGGTTAGAAGDPGCGCRPSPGRWGSPLVLGLLLLVGWSRSSALVPRP